MKKKKCRKSRFKACSKNKKGKTSTTKTTRMEIRTMMIPQLVIKDLRLKPKQPLTINLHKWRLKPMGKVKLLKRQGKALPLQETLILVFNQIKKCLL